MDHRQLLQELLESLNQGKPAVLLTVVEVSGSTPARAGEKMIVFEDGTYRGTIGGGPMEAKAIEDAKEVLAGGDPRCLEYDLGGGDSAEMGMICGGRVRVFIEPVSLPPLLVIVGAGHISQHVAHLAKMVGFRVMVIDDRPEFACRERFPEADEIVVEGIEEALAGFRITPRTYIVIATREHRYDEVALEKVVASEAAYIGMVGSRNKVETIFNHLRAKGVTAEMLSRVRAPIGLKLGGSRPAEIAVGIAAEILQIRYRGGMEVDTGACSD